MPNTQLIYHLAPDLKSIPQIKHILHNNEKLIGQNISSEQIPIKSESKNSTCSNSLNLVNDPKFWTELIKLFIQFPLPTESTFNIKNFNPAKLSQPLLIAIYYSGYQHRSQKPPELTQYMDQLFKVNLKKVLFMPSLQNIQALYIYCQVLFANGEISLTRICFTALSRMLYSLGIHLDSDKFDLNTNFNRKLIFRRVSIFDSSLVGVYKFTPNYIVELPKFWDGLYDVRWYLTPSKWSGFEEEKFVENHLKASITVINNKFYDKTCIIMDFTNNSSTKGLRNDKLFKTKLKALSLAYSEVLGLNQNLKWSYPQQAAIIEEFELSAKVSYTHLSLILLEYWKLNRQSKDYELSQKTLEFSIGLFELISQIESYKAEVFYYYLIGFSLLSNIKDFDKADKSKALKVLGKLKVIVGKNHNEFNSLNFLLFGTGLKLLN